MLMYRESPNNIGFRELTPFDYNKSFIETVSTLSHLDVQKEKIIEIFKELENQGWLTYVIEKNGHVIATASLKLEEERKVAYIKDVAVHPKFKCQEFLGQGFDTQIFEFAKTQATMKQFTVIKEK